MNSPLSLLASDFGSGSLHNADIVADYLELSAIFSGDLRSFSRDLTAAIGLGAEEDFEDVDAEIVERESTAQDAVGRMEMRRRVLGQAYPFELDEDGEEVLFIAEDPDLGQAAYLLSLILSNLPSASQLLNDFSGCPTEQEIRDFRKYFQYFATAAMAAEVVGPAWSFGFPRPDGTGFVEKLSRIWAVLKDGRVQPRQFAPNVPKDDQVDIFAWREQKDELPGFLLAAAQVATGKNWKQKPNRDHVSNVFPKRWFCDPPATAMVPYHVIPFAPGEKFRDDVIVCGNILHRLRVPYRVSEAVELNKQGVHIEGFDRLPDAADSLMSYVGRARVA